MQCRIQTYYTSSEKERLFPGYEHRQTGKKRSTEYPFHKTTHLPKSTHNGVNQRSKYVTQVKQRSVLPTVTLTWHACKYTVHKVHQRYILFIYAFTISQFSALNYLPCTIPPLNNGAEDYISSQNESSGQKNIHIFNSGDYGQILFQAGLCANHLRFKQLC